MPEKPAPAGLILLGAFPDENPSVAFGIDSDGNKDRYIADLLSPGTLQNDTVKIDIRKATFNGAVPPLLNAFIDLFVKIADRSGAHARAPQCLGNILDSTDRYTGQVHLNHSLFN